MIIWGCAGRWLDVYAHTLLVFSRFSSYQLLARLVKNHGHVVDEARDGREAVDMVQDALEGRRAPYDTILMVSGDALFACLAFFVYSYYS